MEWTASLDAALMVGHDRGLGIEELAAMLGHDALAVRERLDAFGRLTEGDDPAAPLRAILPPLVAPRDLRVDVDPRTTRVAGDTRLSP